MTCQLGVKRQMRGRLMLMFNEPSEDSRPAGGRGLEETRALIGKKKEGGGDGERLRAMALWRRRA